MLLDEKFVTLSLNWVAYGTHWFVFKIEQFFCAFFSLCVYTHTHTHMYEGGGSGSEGSGWENTSVCGLTKLSLCSQQ